MPKTEGATSAPHLTSEELDQYERLVKDRLYDKADDLMEMLSRLALGRAMASCTTSYAVAAIKVFRQTRKKRGGGYISRLGALSHGHSVKKAI